MDPTRLPLDPEVEEAPLVAAAEPPLVRPVRPGPNVFMSLVWWLLLLGAQLAIGVGVAVVLTIMAVAQLGSEGFQALMKKTGPQALFELPGAAVVIIGTGTGGTLLVAVSIIAILFRSNARRIVALRGMSFLHAALVVMIAPPALLVTAQIATLATRVLPHLEGNDALFGKLSREAWILVLFAGCILPALGEELFFRGFLSRGLVAKHGVVPGTLFAGALFGLLHLDPPQVVAIGALAIALQVVYLSTKSLFAPILFHALNNALAFALMRFGNDLKNHEALGLDDKTLLPPVLFLAALAATAAVCWLFHATRTRWILPNGEIWSPGYVTAAMPPTHLTAVPRTARPPLVVVLGAGLAYAFFAGILAWEIVSAS